MDCKGRCQSQPVYTPVSPNSGVQINCPRVQTANTLPNGCPLKLEPLIAAYFQKAGSDMRMRDEKKERRRASSNKVRVKLPQIESYEKELEFP